MAAAIALTIAAAFAPAFAPPAAASELTELNGPYIGAGPIAFRAGLDYRWRRREVAIARELDCLQHEVVAGESLCARGSRVGHRVLGKGL